MSVIQKAMQMPERELVAFAKTDSISKAQLSQLIDDLAQAKRQRGESREQAFAKFIEDPLGRDLFQIMKAAPGRDHFQEAAVEQIAKAAGSKSKTPPLAEDRGDEPDDDPVGDGSNPFHAALTALAANLAANSSTRGTQPGANLRPLGAAQPGRAEADAARDGVGSGAPGPRLKDSSQQPMRADADQIHRAGAAAAALARVGRAHAGLGRLRAQPLAENLGAKGAADRLPIPSSGRGKPRGLSREFAERDLHGPARRRKRNRTAGAKAGEDFVDDHREAESLGGNSGFTAGSAARLTGRQLSDFGNRIAADLVELRREAAARDLDLIRYLVEIVECRRR